MARIRRHRRDTVQSPLETYLREINEMALLTADEEKELAHRIADGDKPARDRMVRANLRLVVNIARGYIGKGLALQDLIEEGNLGLLRAVAGVRSRGRHAIQHLRELLDQAVDQARSGEHGQADPHPGLHGRAAVQVAADGVRHAGIAGPAAQRSRRSPRPSSFPRRSWRSSRRRSRSTTSCPRPTSPRTAGAWARCSWTSGPARRTSMMVEADNLRLVLDRLDEMDKREATVLRMRFGLNDAPPKTLKEIGESLGLTRERVRQIENEALGKLSASMQAD